MGLRSMLIKYIPPIFSKLGHETMTFEAMEEYGERERFTKERYINVF